MTLIELVEPENEVAKQDEFQRVVKVDAWERENRILNNLKAHILAQSRNKTQERIDSKIDHLVDFYRRNRISPGESPVLHAILAFMAVYGDQFPRDANVHKAWQYGKYVYEIHNLKNNIQIVLKRDGITLLSFS
jgi:hypothetical protein